MDSCVSEKRPSNELLYNADQFNAGGYTGHAGVTIKSEPYDPSYDAFQTSFCQVQQDSCPLLGPQTQADSNNSASEMEQKWDRSATTDGADISDSSLEQGKVVKTKLENDLRVTQADVELRDVKDEVINTADEEKAETHKELQGSNNGSDLKEESSVSKDAGYTLDQDQLRHKRCKTSHHTVESVRKCLHCQKQFDNEDEFHLHFFKVFLRLEKPPSHQKNETCAEVKKKNVRCRTRLKLEDLPSHQKSEKCAELKRKKVKCRTNLMCKKQTSQISKDCRNVFKSEEAVAKHMLGKHTKGKVCQEKSESKLASVDHLLKPEENECTSFSNNTSESKEDLLNHSLSQNDTKAFVCKQCLKAFDTMESLAAHTCDLEQCNLCLMMFRSKQQLQEHTKLHNVKEGYKACLECGITFPSNKRNEHVKLYHKYGPFPCKTCNKVFGTKSELELHSCSANVYRIQKGVYFCEECNLEFNSWPKVVSHWKIHKYKCDLCTMIFLSQYALSRHSSVCWKERTECRVESSSTSDLAANQKTYVSKHDDSLMSLKSKNDIFKHSLSQDKTFACMLCKKVFGTEEGLILHECDLQQCNICLMMFSSKQQLQEHMKLHNISEGQKVCLECEITFMTRDQLTRHLRNYHKDGPFRCRKCDKMCGNESELKLHNCSKQISGENNEKHYCKQCNMEFDSWSDIVSHWKTHQFKCNVCSKKFLSQYMLSKHTQNCTESTVGSNSSDSTTDQNTNLNKCNSCQMKFESKDLLLEHMKSCHNARFRCTECGLQFDTLTEIQMHKCDAWVYKCDKCSVTFDNRFKYEKHAVSVHKEAIHKCFKCGLGFRMMSKLIKHSLEVHNNLRPFKCEKCSKTFKRKEGLIQHMPSRCKGKNMQELHEGNKIHIYRCGGCKKVLLSQDMLSKHIEECTESTVEASCSSKVAAKQKTYSYKYSHHKKPIKRNEGASLFANDKQFVCKPCKMFFDTKDSLTTHNINSRHKVCMLCEITFLSKVRYDQHVRKYHKGMPFPCGTCNKAFKHKYQLKLHKCSKIASKCEGVPSCEKCKLGFKSWTDAISHQNKTHIYVCGMCSKRFMSQHVLTRHMKECKGMNVEVNTSFKLDDDKVYIYKCSCSMIFQSKDMLVEHMKVCVVNKLINQCSECSLQFDSLSEMQVHTCNSHVHKCDRCAMTFAYRSQFEKHVASVHEGSICDDGASNSVVKRIKQYSRKVTNIEDVPELTNIVVKQEPEDDYGTANMALKGQHADSNSPATVSSLQNTVCCNANENSNVASKGIVQYGKMAYRMLSGSIQTVSIFTNGVIKQEMEDGSRSECTVVQHHNSDANDDDDVAAPRSGICDVVPDDNIRKSIRQYGRKGTISNLGSASSQAEVILPN